MNKILLILILVILIVASALALFLVFQPFGGRLPESSGPFALGELLISEVKYSVDGSGPKFVELQVVDSSGLNLEDGISRPLTAIRSGFQVLSA